VLCAQTAKKGAFYSKEGSRVDVSNAGSNTVSAESNNVNPMKARLVEEVAKEDMRAVQLESLLEAFQSAVVEKEQLITLETQILSEIREVKTKVTDEIILNELNAAIDEKSRLIDAERGICKEISAVSSSLASEVNETREKIAELQKVVDVLPEEGNAIGGAMEDYQTLLKSSIEVSHVDWML
jgi:altronate dehydratase